MIELRWQYTDIHRSEPRYAVLTQNGHYAVLQYRDTRGITGLVTGDEVTVDGEKIEWIDVPLGE